MLLDRLSILLAQYDGHMDWDDGWGIVMVVGMVLFWGLVIVGIIWLVREVAAMRSHHRTAGSPDDPLRILDRRLAEGSISPEEYRERRSMLTGSGP
jgi:putative membrane protein